MHDMHAAIPASKPVADMTNGCQHTSSPPTETWPQKPPAASQPLATRLLSDEGQYLLLKGAYAGVGLVGASRKGPKLVSRN